MRANQVIENCRAGRVSIGAFVNLNDALAAQIMANSGFDWLVLDMEHGPIPLNALQEQITAVRTTGTEPFVRAAWNASAAIQPVLDCGASGIMIPMISNVEQAQAAVRDTRYPPRGARSRGGLRGPLSFQVDSATYFARADDGLFVMAQIETVEAIDNLEAIAAVDGIDCLFVGPADLAASFGFDYPGGWAGMSGPYAEAIAKVPVVAKKFGKTSGLQAASGAIANDCVAFGYDLVGNSNDAALLWAAARAARAAVSAERKLAK